MATTREYTWADPNVLQVYRPVTAAELAAAGVTAAHVSMESDEWEEEIASGNDTDFRIVAGAEINEEEPTVEEYYGLHLEVHEINARTFPEPTWEYIPVPVAAYLGLRNIWPEAEDDLIATLAIAEC